MIEGTLHRLATALWLAALSCACDPAPTSSSAPAATPATEHGLPFVENDWPAALAQARERRVPLFVEAWAPW